MNKTLREIVVLACGGGGCCPEAHFNEDGSVDLVDNDDGRSEHIHLSADQVKVLHTALDNNRRG